VYVPKKAKQAAAKITGMQTMPNWSPKGSFIISSFKKKKWHRKEICVMKKQSDKESLILIVQPKNQFPLWSFWSLNFHYSILSNSKEMVSTLLTV
jgi:hypothetical protein